MTLMKRPLLILAAATALLVSCKIDRDYDLEKPLNTRMILFKDLNIPIGNVGAIPASTLMFLLGTDYITFNDDGHLVLDFTDNPEMVFQFDIKGLKVNVNYEMEKAFGFILDMDVTNTSPFSFSVEASFIDSLGTVIPTYHPLISGGVGSGSVTRPSSSHLMLDVSAEKLVPFDGLRFSFRFDGGDLVGKKHVLDDDEILSFHTLRFNLPEGVPFDPAWINDIVPYWSIFNIFFNLKGK